MDKNFSVIMETALTLSNRLIEALYRVLEDFEAEKQRVNIDEVIDRTHALLSKMEYFSSIFDEPPVIEGQIIQIKYLIKKIDELHNK